MLITWIPIELEKNVKVFWVKKKKKKCLHKPKLQLVGAKNKKKSNKVGLCLEA